MKYALILNMNIDPIDIPSFRKFGVFKTKRQPPFWMIECYEEIYRILISFGVMKSREEGNIYYFSDDVTRAQAIHSIEALSAQLPWFKKSVTNIRLLHLVENENLSDVL